MERTGQESSRVPLMDEGVEAGEDEERHHGTKRHHVAKFRLKDVAVPFDFSVVLRTVNDRRIL